MRKIFILSTLSLFLFSTCKKQDQVIIKTPEIITPVDPVIPLEILSGDSIIFYGASIEEGASAWPTPTRWTTRVSSLLGLKEINYAKSGTPFQVRSAGDLSFMNKLKTVPEYRPTTALIVIGNSNILNDHTYHLGSVTFASELSRAIDTIHLNRHYPLNKIVVATPCVIIDHMAFGTKCSNDSLAIYNQAALTTAKNKKVSYIDNFTYTLNNGNSSLVSADSIHPNNLGHQILAEGFTKSLHKYFTFSEK